MDEGMRAWQGLVNSLGPFVPRLMAAAAIVAAAWLGARLLRLAATRAGQRAGLDERLSHPGFSAMLADLLGWLVWLLALPALLGTLELKGLLDPVNAMLSRLLGYLPNVLGAAVVLGIGLLAANVVRRIVTGVLTAAGSERLAGRMGLAAALGERSLAGMAGSVVFALLLLPTLAAALQSLGLDAVTRPVSQLLDSVMGLIPRLVSAALILVIAGLIGRALASVVAGLLAGLGANRLPAKLGLGDDFNRGGRDASELAGALVLGAVMFVALAQASQVLGLAMLTDAVAVLGSVLAKVVVAVLVMGVGLWLSALAAGMVLASGVAHGRVLGRLVRGAILFFTAALALRQAGLPAEIVTITFGAVVGALAIGIAVAVGVGGRHVAGRLLERAVAAFDKPAPADDADPR
jgi:hypothetical protein